MKYVKMLALAAVAAGALMAFIGAGTASATVLCSTTVEVCPAAQQWPVNTVLDFSVPAGGSLALTDTSGNTLDTCTEGTVEGKLTNAGSSTTTVTGELSTPLDGTGLTWGKCTFTTTTLSTSGKLEVHKIAGTSNGTVTSDSKYEVTINIGVFGSCVYGVEPGTSLGDITEGKGTGAIFHANASVIRIQNPLCPATAKWTGTYVLTAPTETTLSVS